MESISTAASIIGIISISFEYARIKYVEPKRKLTPGFPSLSIRLEAEKLLKSVRLSLSNLISSMERLCDILQMLKMKPRNVMSPLPVELELAAGACASDLIKLESLVRKIQQESRISNSKLQAARMVLRAEHVEEMQAILETHINALEPSARVSSRYAVLEHNIIGRSLTVSVYSVGQPEGSDATSRVSDRVTDEVGSANYIHPWDPPSPNLIRLRDEEGRNILTRNERGGISGRVKNAMQRLHDEEIKFSRPQLYQLLCLLREIEGLKEDDEGKTNNQEETDDEGELSDKKETDYERFKRQSRKCVRRLSNLAETRLTRTRPSVEARDIIVILKEFISEIETRSDPRNHNSVSSAGKRKAGADTGSEISRYVNDSHNFKLARRMSVGIRVPRMCGFTRVVKSTDMLHECGRLADEDGTMIF
ncbi:hypothetical protein B0J15DRAFT_505471 [Fusarium solani]|uniref:Fungal N-terminal domain-containing protein n=1 Tax=Fusarium solani TaxID=169388 RepID=A0A9P9G2H6_FUSSL|nr:uncharacterized protein B0J15DRAFT_505471 [Fusarium solani]KAH7231985.1 hypothetical protein B0J15DRAFT_505471 [Fusarium solani]